MMPKAGDIVLVRYEDDGPWHERLLLYRARGSIWVLATPDYDIYEEEIGSHNADFVAVRYPKPGGGLPPGVQQGTVYGFDAPSDDDKKQLIVEGTEMGRAERERLGLPLDDAPAAAAAGGNPAPVVALTGAALPARVSAAGLWILDEPGTACDLGDIVTAPPAANVFGDRALVDVNGVTLVARMLPQGADPSAYLALGRIS